MANRVCEGIKHAWQQCRHIVHGCYTYVLILLNGIKNKLIELVAVVIVNVSVSVWPTFRMKSRF